MIITLEEAKLYLKVDGDEDNTLITDLIKTLHDPTLSLQSKEFLRLAINNSMHHIYWGMIIFSFLILIALISVPHISPKGDHIVKD